MNLRAWMLVLAVPVIAFGAGLGIQADLNSELRTAVRKQFPNADEARVSQVTVTVAEHRKTRKSELLDRNILWIARGRLSYPWWLVLVSVKALRFAPTPLRGAYGLDRDSARASEHLWRPLNIDRRCPDFRAYK